MEIRKKGLIFSLDSAIAVTVVIIMLINSSYYFSTSAKESISQLQLIKLGNDITNILYLTGGLKDVVLKDLTLNPPGADPTFKTEDLDFTDYLPISYNMTYLITDLMESVTTSYKICVEGTCSCDADGCTGIFTVDTLDIEASGNYLVKAKVTLPSGQQYGILHLKVKVDGQDDQKSFLTFTESGTGIIPFLYSFKQGVNEITFNTTSDPLKTDDNIELNWFKVLGTTAYAGQMNIPVPEKKFIGTGERLFEVYDSNNNFEGVHMARFYIWTK